MTNTPAIRKQTFLTCIVSVFNEAESLPLLHIELTKHLKKLTNLRWEVLYINDGSTDDSLNILNSIAEQDSSVTVIHFSKNFGHEAAMTAGIHHAKGDALLCMDADLQHPPRYIEKMLNAFYQGADIVLMKRKPQSATAFRDALNTAFYKLLNTFSQDKIEDQVTDFFLISRKVKEVIHQHFSEQSRFTRGIIQTVGFKKKIIEFQVEARVKGKSKYNLLNMLGFSSQAFIAFSRVPLRFSIFLGLVMGTGSFIVGVFSLIMRYLGFTIPGYTTTVVLISFLFSAQFVILGILAEYIGVLITETKRRPLYIIDKIVEGSTKKE